MKLRSLFVKIFLWFWLTMLLVSLTLEATMWLTRPDFDFFESMNQSRWKNQCIGIIDILENQGKDAATRAADSFPFRPDGIMIFDETHNEIFGSKAEESVILAVNATLTGLKPVSGKTSQGEFKTTIILGDSGKRYICINSEKTDNRRPPRRFGFLFREKLSTLLLRISILIFTTFILCYFLTRYLTNPIVRLQKAARQLAQGKLNHRIQADMSGRQDELIDLAQDFDLMAERVEELLTSQRRLLGDISHELRTPLTRLNVALELVRSSSGEEAEKLLDRISCESGRLQELINRIVTLVRLEGAQEHFTKGPLDLSGLIESIVSDTEIEAGERQCSINCRCDEDCIINGSGELMRRAVENVIRNAIRHTPEGTTIDVSCTRNSEAVTVKVTDHGTGVEEKNLEHLFEPFYRCEAARERTRGGVGLGLAIVKRSMEFHGGSALAVNNDGAGLSVILTLPLSHT
jgi:two-component system sensor histidine kinase CpxA